MAATSSSRVENALEKLLEQLVPHQLPGEREDEAEQRWERANNLARTLINTQRGSDNVRDVASVADLINRGLLEGRGGERSDSGRAELERATRFGNLYSRLLAQPVLSRKWAILWFLWKVGEGTARDEGGNGVNGRGGRAGAPYDDAFERDGLGRIPRAEAEDTPLVRETVPARRPNPPSIDEANDRPREELSAAKAPHESMMLRDLPYTLQGLSSTSLPFGDAKALKLPTDLPVPIISLLHSLAEPALLYKSLAAFANDTAAGQGLVNQSLRSTIGAELRAYLSLVAQIEGQIRRTLQQESDGLAVKDPRAAAVTLKRLHVWTRDATLGLRLMNLLVHNSAGKKGGELISMVHSFATSHGDKFVYTFADKVLRDITRPFYTMLRAWIYDGELEDPYNEFFVCENEDDENSGAATSVWEHKYSFQLHMVPSDMTVDIAKRVFLIGKSLNFIRYSCADSSWVEDYSRSNSHALSYGDNAALSASVDTAYTTVMARLLQLMEKKFALFTHLKAMKKYLLLGQGDFIAELMESLAANLDRPANSQYRHTLTAKLEGAIRNSNAQYDDPEVIRRLDSRMLELSHGEIGWDVFTLEYRIDAPLDVIVTPWASKQYLKVFNFLWRVKRVEFALGTTWRRCMTGARGVLSNASAKLQDEWKLARGSMAEMVHFINQLQWYILFEVIEAGWEKFQHRVRKPDATLDTLIEAHTEYLRHITRKGLLASGAMDFTSQLHELLKLMLAYRDAVDSLYSLSVADFTRKQEQAAKIETRTKAGRWGVAETDDDNASAAQSTYAGDNSPIPPLINMSSRHGAAGSDQSILEHLHSRLHTLRLDFRTRVCILLGDLRDQPDTEMRHLGTAMNFNDAYTPVRRRRAAVKNDKDKGKARETEPKAA